MSIFDRFRLDGRVAVVTGAAGGIGRAVVVAFRDAGARVVALDLNADSLSELVGPSGEALPIDISDPDAVHQVFQGIIDGVGPVDVLVNNAGISFRSAAVDLTPFDWDRVLAINLRGAMLCAKEAAPGMIQRGRGSIINVSSQLALAAAAERAAYVSSKAGLVGLTRALAVEWAKNGVRVNSVAPGVTRTPMVSYLEQNEAAGNEFRARIPMGRFGEPEEIAAAVLFLASDASSYVTGQVLVADGGYSVP